MFSRQFPFELFGAPTSAIIHQLTDEEMQRFTSNGINRFSAAFNIKLIEKEDTFMVEKLEAYKAELEAKKATLENTVIDVEAEVAEFRAKREAEEKAKITADIAKVVSDIDCINGLIEREKAAIEAPAVEITNETVVE